MVCPFCQSDNLIAFKEEDDSETYCCDDCGGSFQIINEPQDILLKED